MYQLPSVQPLSFSFSLYVVSYQYIHLSAKKKLKQEQSAEGRRPPALQNLVAAIHVIARGRGPQNSSKQ
jgi:hypothetical protein